MCLVVGVVVVVVVVMVVMVMVVFVLGVVVVMRMVVVGKMVVVVEMVVVVVVILVMRNVSMVYLWGSRWRWDAFPVSGQGELGPFCPEIHLCCYANTGTKYPSTLTIEMQTIFKQVGLFTTCTLKIKEMKSFAVGHDLQPPVDVQDLVVM